MSFVCSVLFLNLKASVVSTVQVKIIRDGKQASQLGVARCDLLVCARRCHLYVHKYHHICLAISTPRSTRALKFGGRSKNLCRIPPHFPSDTSPTVVLFLQCRWQYFVPSLVLNLCTDGPFCERPICAWVYTFFVSLSPLPSDSSLYIPRRSAAVFKLINPLEMVVFRFHLAIAPLFRQ